MRKYIVSFVFLLLLSIWLSAQNDAYVINGLAETLSKIDLETGQVVNHVVTLGSVPNQVICHDEFLFVVNSFSPSLMIIDPGNNSILAEIPMPINSNPWNVAVFDNHAYITGLATSTVYVVDITKYSRYNSGWPVA